MKLNQLHESPKALKTVLVAMGVQPTEVVTFNIEGKKVQSLVGSPKKVTKDFNCTLNLLKTLEGGPEEVGGDYDCKLNFNMQSLKGAPTLVGGDFIARGCGLKTLTGGPAEVLGDFIVVKNKIESLALIHKSIKKINGIFNAADNPGLTKNLLGLIMISGLTKIVLDNKEIAGIMNRHLKAESKKLAMLKCQQELIEAGFEEAAQL